jgi:hypothetical protein
VVADHSPSPAHNRHRRASAKILPRRPPVDPFFVLFEEKIEGENAEFFITAYRNTVQKRRKKPKNARKSFTA